MLWRRPLAIWAAIVAQPHRLVPLATATVSTCTTAHCDVVQRLPGIHIPNDYPQFPLDSFPIAKHYIPYLDHVMIPNGLIQNRIEKLVEALAIDLQDQETHMLCVLKGASTFFADILTHWIRRQEHTHLPLRYDFIRAKSYSGNSSTGLVSIDGMSSDALQGLAGKHVVVVEDIIDTGLTMQHLVERLQTVRPASIRVVSFLEKRTQMQSLYRADYVAFSVPDRFVVGYGMDYNEAFRDMRHLAVINQAGMETFL